MRYILQTQSLPNQFLKELGQYHFLQKDESGKRHFFKQSEGKLLCLLNHDLQDYKFENPFYEPPSILASATHENGTRELSMKADGRYSNALTVWIEVSILEET